MSEYNLKSIKEQFKQNGVFYTPPELANELKKYVDFEPKEVYDPTCGNGALLSVFDESVAKYGQELDGVQLQVASSRLKNFTGVCGDTLASPAFMGKKFDCIVANPPFSIKWDAKMDERFSKCGVLAPNSKADYAFLLHILYYLSENGIAVVLNFPGILYRGNKERDIRKWMVDNNYIEKIVNIPPNTFVDTKIATALIVLRKNKKTTDIEFEDKSLNKKRNVALEEIKENDYNLSVSNYIIEEKEVVTIDPIELQNDARSSMLKRIDNDIKVDFMVCDFENIDKMEYLNSIQKIIDKYKGLIS